MADDVTASFNLSVESNAAQIARDGADGLVNLQGAMQDSVGELRNLNAAFRSLKGGAGVSSQALDELKQRIGAQKSAIAAQQQAYLKAGGTFRELADKAKGQADQAKRQAAQEAAQMAHSLAAKRAEAEAEKERQKRAGLHEKSLAIQVAKGTLLASTIKGGAEQLVAFAAAALRAAAGVAAFGIETADARRSELLQLEGLTKIRYGLFGLGAGYQIAADKASFLQEQIDAVASGSAVSRDKIAGYADQLYRTGLRAGNLQAALEGMTITASTQGEGQAQRFAGMAAGARMAGISVRKLADDVKARLGGIAEAQTLSLSVQLQKLHESYAMLFSGVKLEPFLRGLKSVTDLFKLNTIQGVALKGIIETMLQPMIDGAPTVGELVKNVFEGIIIGALTLINYFQDIELAYYKAFGSPKVVNNINLMRMATHAGEMAIAAFAGVALGLVGTLVGLGAAAWYVIEPFYAMASAADNAYTKWQTLSDSSKDLGKNFVLGVVNSITNGVPDAVAAVFGLGGAMIAAFRKRMEIHSPSRVMFSATSQVVAGAVNSLKAGKPAVEKATRENVAEPMVSSGPADGGGAASGGAAAKGGGGNSFSFAAGAIVVQAAGAAAGDIQMAVQRALEALLAGKLVTAGGTVV